MSPDERRVVNTTNMIATASLDATLGHALQQALVRGVKCASFTREIPTEEAGIFFCCLSRDVFLLLGQSLIDIAVDCERGNKGKGALSIDESATMRQVFAWLDETPTRSAHGFLRVVINGRAVLGYVFGFTGPVCARVKTTLQSYGLSFQEGGAA